MKRIVTAALQFSVEPMAVERNLQRAYELLCQCHETTKAELVVLPESFTTGFTPVGDVRDLWKTVDTIPGRLTDRAVAWAKELNTYIVFPTYERGKREDIVYNSAALVGPQGVLGVYRKTHPFPTERREAGGWTTPGHKPLCVETPIGNIGIVICYDGDFPELARVTTLQGAEIICRPSAFMRTFDHWELTNRARAYDNHVYWVAANSVGPDAGGSWFFGSSMIVHPTGVKMAQARACDEFIWAELDPDPIRTVVPNASAPQHFDHLEDRNLTSYAGILRQGRSAFEPARRIPYQRWR
ncbi:MAG: Aliphatic amidase amiE [Candidatus Ozemobacter sibiricus]|jgi:predicted amidohydrolase|uniref:Aliphatic amidase amiE n=1 Tax=Candidatus Ozemobacter sibiricus TaxID=2268124 RepID=A0A367ZQV3_9BACT|nr:MAG: Aliphatic amidase amiE [Candidatus Ozemobacter sibiricus]